MDSRDDAAALAERILDFRRRRSDLLPDELFGELGWDILLELFVADAKGERLTADQVCERSKAARTVASRWLMYLTEEKLIIGDGDGNLDDPLTLSGDGFAQMERLLADARRIRISTQVEG